MYEPLKITAYPRCGIIADAYLPIDGILFYAAMRQLHGPQMLSTPGHVPDIEYPTLPLGIREEHGEWFYAASFAQWDAYADGQEHWNKRFDMAQSDLIDFAGRRGRVIVEQARYKSYHMPMFYRHALSVSWYVVGDRAGVSDLLSTMTHIGKKAAQGWGRINEWEVNQVGKDWSTYDDDGNLMRSIPAAQGIVYGIRPSYWLRENQVTCQMPD